MARVQGKLWANDSAKGQSEVMYLPHPERRNPDQRHSIQINHYTHSGGRGLACFLSGEELAQFCQDILSQLAGRDSRERQYLADKGLRCPVCHSTNIGGSSPEPTQEGYDQPMQCSNCESGWVDELTVTGYYNLVNTMPNGDDSQKDEQAESDHA